MQLFDSQKAISKLSCAPVSKRLLKRNLSYENELHLHENDPVGETHFWREWFRTKLVLKQRQKTSWKWPIASQLEYLQREPLWVEVLVDKVNPMFHRHHQA